MRKILVLLAVMLLSAIPSAITAGDLTPAEKDFFAKHTSDLVRLEPTKLDDPAMTKVFSTVFYAVKVFIKQADGDMSTDIVVAQIGDKLVSVSRPSSDADLPDFLKLFNPNFKLATDDDAKTLQSALDTAYPIIGDDNIKAQAVQHVGNTWTLIRGVFFDDKMGYVFQTDAAGKITSAKFMLKLPK